MRFIRLNTHVITKQFYSQSTLMLVLISTLPINVKVLFIIHTRIQIFWVKTLTQTSKNCFLYALDNMNIYIMDNRLIFFFYIIIRR